MHGRVVTWVASGVLAAIAGGGVAGAVSANGMQAEVVAPTQPTPPGLTTTLPPVTLHPIDPALLAARRRPRPPGGAGPMIITVTVRRAGPFAVSG